MFDENIARTEEFPDTQSHIVVEKIRQLGVDKVHIGAAATGLDLQATVEQEFRSQFPKEDWIERGRKRGDLAVACLEHALGPTGQEEFGCPKQ